MERIDAVEVLQALKPWRPRPMLEKSLRTTVNVARVDAHSVAEFKTLLNDMQGQGWVRIAADAFGDRKVTLTDAGENVLADAGAAP